MKQSKYWIIPLMLLLWACEKEDLPVAPNTGVSYQFDMGNSYTYQAYFDLSSGTFKSENSKFEWDLAFESNPESNAIYLNSARLMKAFATESTNFDSIYTVDSELEWKWDKPNGRATATAIGQWWTVGLESVEEVYLIDLGVDEEGNSLGFKKMIILSASEQNYVIRFAELDGSDEVEMTVERDINRSRNMISLKDAEQLEIEPVYSQWDLHFTNYTEELWDGEDTVSYLVTGVLINRYGTMAAFDDSLEYDNIEMSDVVSIELSSAANVIGYNWKYFDFDALQYTIVEGQNYVLKDLDGIYYKLRFIGFYNSQGEKGSPQFQYEKL
jgi:hypothetical protein